MRFLFKAEMDTDTANATVRSGNLAATVQSILDELKPEAAYFMSSNGKRTALLIINVDDASEIPAIAEPWLLAFGASIDFIPVMLPDDLKKAGPSIEAAGKKFT